MDAQVIPTPALGRAAMAAPTMFVFTNPAPGVNLLDANEAARAVQLGMERADHNPPAVRGLRG